MKMKQIIIILSVALAAALVLLGVTFAGKNGVQSELDAVTAQLDTVKAQMEEAVRASAAELSSAKAQAEQAVQQAVSDAALAQETADSLTAQLAAAQQEAAESAEALLQAQQQALSAQENAEALQGQLAEAQQNAESLKAELADARQNAEALQNQLTETQQSAQALEAQLTEAQQYAEALAQAKERAEATARQAEAVAADAEAVARQAEMDARRAADELERIRTAVTAVVNGTTTPQEVPIAYIMYENADKTLRYYGKDATPGVTATVADVQDEGTYTVALQFDQPSDGLFFMTLCIENAEITYPGWVIDVAEIKVNGQPIAFGGTYTTSDDGVRTRVNLFNEWETELPEDARGLDEKLTDVSAVAVDPQDFAAVEAIEITFDFISPETLDELWEAQEAAAEAPAQGGEQN